MKRWLPIQIVSALLLMVCITLSGCRQAKEPVLVGLLNNSMFTEDSITGFKEGMEALGYVEDETIQYLYAGIIEEPDALAQEAQRLVANDVDVIFTVGTPSGMAAQTATNGRDIPVVFDAVIDAQLAGLVESRQNPGGHMTGISVGELGSQIIQKNIEWLLTIAPETRRIYAIYDADLPAAFMAPALASLTAVGEQIEAEIVLSPMNNLADAQTLAQMLEEGDALFVFNSPLTFDFFVDQALTQGVPLGTQSHVGVEQGALFAYVMEFNESGKQGARLVDQILQGQDPAQLPVEFPELYLSLNLQTAEKIDLEISTEVLAAAHRLIR